MGTRTGLVVGKIVPVENQSPVRPAQRAITVTITLFCVISGVRRDVGDICALLGYYGAQSGNTNVSGQTVGPIFKGQEVQHFSTLEVGDFLTIEDGTDRLTRNVGMELRLYAAVYPRSTLSWFISF